MGSGKSSVAGLLRARGYSVIDADEIVHGLLSPGSPVLEEVISTFGQNLRAPDGTLNRRTLGQVVFSNPEKRAELESILHPQVRAEVARRKSVLASSEETAGFYEVPLLFEKNMESQFDAILVVTASRENRMARLRRRTGLSVAEIEERWKAQWPPELKESRATVLIRNDGDLAQLEKSVVRALSELGLSPAVTQT